MKNGKNLTVSAAFFTFRAEGKGVRRMEIPVLKPFTTSAFDESPESILHKALTHKCLYSTVILLSDR